MKLKHWPTLVERRIGEICPRFPQTLACSRFSLRCLLRSFSSQEPPASVMSPRCLLICGVSLFHQLSCNSGSARVAIEGRPGFVPVTDMSYRGGDLQWC